MNLPPRPSRCDPVAPSTRFLYQRLIKNRKNKNKRLLHLGFLTQCTPIPPATEKNSARLNARFETIHPQTSLENECTPSSIPKIHIYIHVHIHTFSSFYSAASRSAAPTRHCPLSSHRSPPWSPIVTFLENKRIDEKGWMYTLFCGEIKAEKS